MADPKRPGPTPVGIAMALLLLAGLAVATLERGSQALLAAGRANGHVDRHWAPVARLLNRYLDVREHVLAHRWLYGAAAILAPAAVLWLVKRWTASMYRWREQASGMALKVVSYDLTRRVFDLRERITKNRDGNQVILGVDGRGQVVTLSDHARSMHVHVLGQTGSGKTRGVIEPLLFQDLRRGRGVLVVDGKGSQENEERLASMAWQVGRLDQVRIFTLNPTRTSHTYNPLHLVDKADPRAVGERVFSSFMDDMDNPYYRDQSRMFFVALVEALAGTGKRFTMRDLAAAIASPEVLDVALTQTSDGAARRAIQAQTERLGRKAGETFTGLLAAVGRYDHPSVNVYDPDIVLEEAIEAGIVLGFFLPANYYKQLARYLGLAVFQHLQQVGALRQLDRSRSQRPLYVYADEFYSFAYEGFTDAVNKLRDAHISILLAHQTWSDLEKVSPEYAQGIWDNTRNKIILFQNDPKMCDRIAMALGTEQGVELTVRRSVDSLLTAHSTLEASSRQVDTLRLHPNRIKALQLGQAYLCQDAQFVGVNLQPLPDLPVVAAPVPKPRSKDGIGLHELFVRGK